MATLNKGEFDRLTAEQQAAVRAAAEEAEKFAWDALASRTVENYKMMGENGVTVVGDLDPGYVAALIAGGEKARSGWVEEIGDKGRQIIADFEKRAGR
jgi:TRAP-type C4-dicarboxylate transport system substrate-binding protein